MRTYSLGLATPPLPGNLSAVPMSRQIETRVFVLHAREGWLCRACLVTCGGWAGSSALLAACVSLWP